MTALAEGSVLGPLQAGPVSRTVLALFAGASGDHNPIHIDTDAARAAGLQDVFAHGMLSMAYLGRLLTDHFPQRSIRDFQVRFTAITPVHAVVTCAGRVTGITETDGTPVASLELTATIDDGTVTVRGTAAVDLAENGGPHGKLTENGRNKR
jgi:acyl dehydratase